MQRIGAVIVTYNRLEKLKHALNCFDTQNVLPEYILVVNNASKDGTEEYLTEWEAKESKYRKIVITKKKNTGGSGGFYTGLEASLKLNADWIWVSDDDAYPRINAIEESYRYLNSTNNSDSISALCGMIINKGEIDLEHRKIMKSKGLKVYSSFPNEKAYEDEYFEINCFTYVGTIINKKKIEQVGLPQKDYFIWCDDTEHSLRLSKVGKIICVPSIIVDHDTPSGDGQFSWKTYYGIRNSCDMYRRHFPFRCYLYHCLKLAFDTYRRDGLIKQSDQSIAVRKGIIDSIKKKYGIDDMYRPGWTPGSDG